MEKESREEKKKKEKRRREEEENPGFEVLNLYGIVWKF